jgi:hypothetical protein
MHSRAPLLFCAASALVVATSVDARADDTHECIVASNEGQVLRDEHKLVEATARFSLCARDVCPALVRKACLEWRGEVETQLPTVVLAARDATGHDLLEVRVLVDGKPLVEKLDGSAVAIDPGPHVVRFESAGRAPAEQDFILREGEKNRLVSVVVGPAVAVPGPTPAPAASNRGGSGLSSGVVADRGEVRPHRPWPVASFILAGVGAAALGSFAYFGISGQADRNSLEQTCAPSMTCDPSDVASMRTKLIVADVSLGVGIVSLAVSLYLVITRPSNTPPHATLTPPPMDARSWAGWNASF